MVDHFRMTQQLQNNKGMSSIVKYKTTILLVLLPVVLALYVNGGNIMGIIPTLTSSAFPIALSLLSWGFAVQQLVHVRRK